MLHHFLEHSMNNTQSSPEYLTIEQSRDRAVWRARRRLRNGIGMAVFGLVLFAHGLKLANTVPDVPPNADQEQISTELVGHTIAEASQLVAGFALTAVGAVVIAQSQRVLNLNEA